MGKKSRSEPNQRLALISCDGMNLAYQLMSKNVTLRKEQNEAINITLLQIQKRIVIFIIVTQCNMQHIN